MNYSRFGVVRGLLLLVALGAGSCAWAQDVPVDPAVKPCTDAQLDVRLRSFRAPDAMHVMAIEYRNTGSEVCRLQIFRKQNGYTVDKPKLPRVNIGAGEVVHSSFRWLTVSMPGIRPCTQGVLYVITGTVGKNIVVRSPAFAPPVCAVMQDDTNYHPGPFVPDWKMPASRAAVLPLAPNLSAAKQQYFENERATLRITLNDRAVSDSSCPVLLMKDVDAKGAQVILEFLNPKPDWAKDDARGDPNMYCRTYALRDGPRNQYRYPVTIGPNFTDKGLGRHTFSVVQLVEPSGVGEIQQVSSQGLSLEALDPANVERTWGTAEKGVHVALNLDKTEYTAGQDIPLHVAVGNVDAAVDVYPRRYSLGYYETADLYSVKIVVQGEHGTLPLKQQVNAFSAPDPCPDVIAAGKSVPVELQLTDLVNLPPKPGTYRVFALWTPYTSSRRVCGEDADPKDSVPYVSVASPMVTVQVGGGDVAVR